ncbi:MAG: hypothetical protein QOH15_1430, partial [Gaiellales bacterium]|nr:hypothetical protein [Gaiellales bacterium]
MLTRFRGVLAALPILLALQLAPSASAHCGLIDAYVLNGKAWYSANETPPTVLFDMADDEGTPRDFMNETTGSWLNGTPAGAYGFIATPGWITYAAGDNSMRVQLHCASGLQTMRTLVRYDPIRPLASWSNPAAGEWLRGTVLLKASGSDGLSGVGSYTIALPTGPVSSSDGGAWFDTTGANDGATVVSAVSVDNVGNRSDPVTRVFKIDNGVPVVAIAAPASAALVASASVQLAATASDAQSGVARVRFEGRPGTAGAWQALGSTVEAPYRLSLATPAVEGEYQVRAVAADAIGNEAASPGSTLVIDRIAPVASLAALQPLVSGTIGLSAVATDAVSGVAHVEFQAAPAGSDDWQPLATDDTAPYSARVATPALADGAYAMRVLARDAAGNETTSDVRSTLVRNAAVPNAPGAAVGTPAIAPAAPAEAVSAARQAV